LTDKLFTITSYATYAIFSEEGHCHFILEKVHRAKVVRRTHPTLNLIPSFISKFVVLLSQFNKGDNMNTNKFSPTPLAIAISLALTTTPSQAIVYTYDNLQRLTGAQYTSGQLLTYQYDPAGNLLNINNRRAAYHLIIGADDNQVVIRSLKGDLEKSFTVNGDGQGLSIAGIDLEGDGVEEITVAKQQGSNSVTFYKLDGTAKNTLVTPFNGLSLATGEMNSDGSSEIAVAPRIASGNQIALYSVAGSPVDTLTVAKTTSFSIAIGDVNGDGKGEVVTGNLLGNEVMVSGGMTFLAFEPKTPTLRKKDGDAGDKKVTICHKGKNTLTVAEPAVSAHLAHGDSLGECAPPATASSPLPTSSLPATPGTSPETTTPSVVTPPLVPTTPSPEPATPTTSTETIPPVTTLSLPLIYGVNVATGDVNGDGKAEIVAAMANEGSMIEIYTGQGIFLNQFQAFENNHGVVITTGDVNYDGRAEIIAGDAQGTAVRIFTLEGQLVGNFQGLNHGKITSLAFSKEIGDIVPSTTAPTPGAQMPVTSPTTSALTPVTTENPTVSTLPQPTETTGTISPVASKEPVTVNTPIPSNSLPVAATPPPQATVAVTSPVVESLPSETTVVTAPPMPIVPAVPACSTTETTMTETCRGQGQTLTNVTINSGSSIAEVKLAGDINNQGWVSNAIILDGAILTGGVLTGHIENHGRVVDIRFVGAQLTGGELAGTISVEKWGALVNVTILFGANVTGGRMSGEVNNQGTLANIRVMTETTINGGKLAGTIENQGLLRGISLVKGARIRGGRLAGEVVGESIQKGVIKAARVLNGAKLVNVVVGKGTYVETGVVIGEGVAFE
jgi:YD repeat-containing protein